MSNTLSQNGITVEQAVINISTVLDDFSCTGKEHKILSRSLAVIVAEIAKGKQKLEAEKNKDLNSDK